MRGTAALVHFYKWYVAAAALVLAVTGAVLPPLLHWWSWEWSVPLAAVALCLLVLEGAYRLWGDTEGAAATAEQERDELREKISTRTAALPAPARRGGMVLRGVRFVNNDTGIRHGGGVHIDMEDTEFEGNGRGIDAD